MQGQMQTFYAYSDGQGNLFTQDLTGAHQIGVSLEKYKNTEKMASDALAKAEEYQKKLIDAGLIQKPMSPEEQMSLLMNQVSLLSEQVAKLTKLSEVKDECTKSINNVVTE